jgi:hypothetical protein
VRRLAACLLALVVAAGCGGTHETREPDVVVREATPAGRRWTAAVLERP